ncbi:hypothetical protein M406DRAFT_76022 [Cryphonectria parasitica EP155]|uniref:Uncharacterized protein n=1 Tax=Cryphonectria parasitica (strain ATCC 38755 / EP155) TaxID=660469 RepID=A0A9P4XSZ4_CRYP1|nr:uncharacterized protein M406DRAFT_76022 [Cryphonectria parasitica EP155]KAF3760363.1 hypothetical protein M406DRAFT_76022 [Cryphonectria parasitica EP155]
MYIQTNAVILTLVGAASALVARFPIVPVPETLIQYQRWCPVCDTVAMNYKCINAGSSCQASVFMPPAEDVDGCTASCSSTCQLSYVANSDYGYTCNATLTNSN